MVKENVSKMNFQEELENLINRHSMENGSNTPDYVLAKYLYECLENFNNIIRLRENHYGRELKNFCL